MKMNALKKSLALWLSLMLLTSAFVLTVCAEATTENAENAAEPYVIIPAAEMEGKLTPNAFSTAEIVDLNGVRLLRLSVQKETNDPYVAFDLDDTYSADVYKYMTLLVRSDVQNNNTMFEIFYGTEGNGGAFKGGNRVLSRYVKMSSWQFLTFDYTEANEWTGNIQKIRYDFFSGGNWPVGVSCEIAGLVLSSSIEGLYEAANDLLLSVCPPVQQISDFTEADLPHVSHGCSATGISLKDGNLLYLSMPNYGDTHAAFHYDSLATERGIKKLTTDDFRYTVIRYRTSMTIPNTSMELFIMTGGTKNLMDMIRIAGTYSCHSGEAKYQNTRTWRGVMVDMAEDDGLEKNTGLKYGWKGRGEFNGFRFDWCGTGAEGAYMEVSEFLFFKSKGEAAEFTNALNTLNIPLPVDLGDIEDDTYETEHVVMPWETETETETVTEETLPAFIEDTTEEVVEDTTEAGTVTETESGEPIETETQKPNDGNGTPSDPNFGGIDISGGDSEAPADTGSQVPFAIACVLLAMLCVASVVTVLVIRAKERTQVA